MSDKSKTTIQIGTPLLGMLGVVFVIAKIWGYINWSWWLVLLPFYAGLAFAIFILLLVLLLKIIGLIIEERSNKRLLCV